MQRILVFGATSTIAAHACRTWAARGDRLHLVGRDPAKLARVAADCAAAAPGGRDTTVITTAAADLAATDRAAAVVQSALDAMGGALDVVLIAHGDLGDQLRSEQDYAEAERILTANLLSAVALIVPLANHLEQQRRGTLAVITSVAGERGRPRNYTYGAAKGALGLYLQGVRSRLHGAGVTVTTLKLGPVDTPMTVGHRKNALFATAERAADDIVAAIDRRAAEVFVPWYWRGILAAVRNMPEVVFQRLAFLSGR